MTNCRCSAACQRHFSLTNRPRRRPSLPAKGSHFSRHPDRTHMPSLMTHQDLFLLFLFFVFLCGISKLTVSLFFATSLKLDNTAELKVFIKKTKHGDNEMCEGATENPQSWHLNTFPNPHSLSCHREIDASWRSWSLDVTKASPVVYLLRPRWQLINAGLFGC